MKSYLISRRWQHWDTFTAFTETAIESISIVIGGYAVVVQGVDRSVIHRHCVWDAGMVVVIGLVWHCFQDGIGHFHTGKLGLAMSIAFIWSF